ncbi:YitT family protein [Flavobacteriaceae bacterium TP-CH-4]|uniref:YitT family protein n=1 Tax=Pelagihabitans pacificus TaxID=2696054 RepID=A0A967AY36_9FLAO|nr:YitT family protein [Pelagihabitans pacificus]NHF58691.1 YitT family protein [Pelagihabitans pacificus]
MIVSTIDFIKGTDWRLMVKDTFFIVTGVFGAAFGLESFLFPNRFIDGGATGISLLVAEVTGLSLPLLILLVNIPFIVLAFRVIGKTFAIKATIAIILLALVLATINFPEVTQDKLLVAVFGGFFLGAGIGLSIRGGAVLDGTEVLAIFLSRKMGTTIGDVIIMINVLVFLAAAYLLSVETALYSMLTYLAASKTLDFVIEGIEEYTGVTIISDNSDDLRLMIINKLGRGVTIYPAKGGYGKNGVHNEYDVLFTVITRLEIRKLNIEISKIDPKAFVVMNKLNDTRGGMIKKRVL